MYIDIASYLNGSQVSIAKESSGLQENLCQAATLKKIKKNMFKTNYLLMQVNELQNAQKGAFSNTFDLH